MSYQVNECFNSIQGEGVLVGRPSTFVRLQGCTVGCWWCDSGPLADRLEQRNTNGETRNTWHKGGKRMTIDEINELIDTPHMIITGGEPTLWDLDGLIDLARQRGMTTQLETSGQNGFKGKLRTDYITWSPKPNLKWQAADDIFWGATEVKWVVDEALDLDQVMATFKEYLGAADSQGIPVPAFVLMPEGCPPKQEHIHRTLLWLQLIPREWQNYFRFGDRLQYRLNVR